MTFWPTTSSLLVTLLRMTIIKEIIVVRIGRRRNSYSLLVGIQTDAASMKITMEDF